MEAPNNSTKKKKGRQQQGKQQKPPNFSPAAGKVDSVRQQEMAASARPPATPPKAAYAGATFHASPAPSSLPIPTFFSKSVPDLPTVSAQDSSETSDGSPVRPTTSATGDKAQREESPLDIFFRADREEKAREQLRSTSGTNITSPPNPTPRTPHSGEDSPSAKSYRNHSRHPTDSSISDIFPLEMDRNGEGTRAPGPAFATPFQERMKALRSQPSPDHSSGQSSDDENVRKTHALKQILMTSPSQSRSSPSSRPGFQDPPDNTFSSPRASRPPHNGATSPTSVRTTPPQSNAQTHFTGQNNGQEQPVSAPQSSNMGHRSANSGARLSNLRQEVKLPGNASPTNNTDPNWQSNSRYQGPNAHTFPRNLLNAHINGESSTDNNVGQRSTSEPQAAFRGPADGATNRPTGTNTRTESLEADLRRMLNLSASPQASAAPQRTAAGGQDQ
ncbi:MAG: Cell wall assembly regulator [Chaenotheca gracillima]|nr:MAG: Cell wall assembly regulator [Chaenotheca gracillima]